MSRAGTPFGGLDEIAKRIYIDGADFDLVLYTNTPNSLGDSTVTADLVQPTGPGYAPITLNGVWSRLNGLVTYDHGTPDNPMWTAGGAWSAPVTGAAMISGATVVHFKDYNDAGGNWVAANGKKLAVDITNLVG